MTLERDYAGKLAIVTGAGDGIGEMLARQLASAGMQLAFKTFARKRLKRSRMTSVVEPSRWSSTYRIARLACPPPKRFAREDHFPYYG